MLTLDLASPLRSLRRSTDSEEVGPEEKDFSNGLGSRWCFAVERTGELLRMGLAGGLVAVAGRGDCTAIIVIDKEVKRQRRGGVIVGGGDNVC